MQIAGILILDQFGINIFNNNGIQMDLSDILSGISLSTNDSESPLPTNIDISKTVKQTYNINNSNISEINIDSSQVFISPANAGVTSYLSINIPKNASNNEITNIILFFDGSNSVNNTNMLNNLNISLYNLNNKLISFWKSTNNQFNNNINYLSIIFPNADLNPTTTSISGFANIKNKANFQNVKQRSNFVSGGSTVIATVVDPSLVTPVPTSEPTASSALAPTVSSALAPTVSSASSASSVPTASSFPTRGLGTFSFPSNILPGMQGLESLMNDIKSMFPDITPDQITDLINSGVDISSLVSNGNLHTTSSSSSTINENTRVYDNTTLGRYGIK